MALRDIPVINDNRIKSTTSKIVGLDIERLKGEFVWDDRYDGLTISGTFWDLNNYKHKLGRIPADRVTLWPRTFLVCWKDYFSDEVEHAAEWQPGGAEGMLKKVWHVLDEADVLYGHNINWFDLPKLHGAFAEMGWGEPLPYKTIDTLQIARKLGYESNTLDALTTRFGIQNKVAKYDHDLALAAVAGDKKAQEQNVFYCGGDVVADEGLMDFLRPRIKNHPHLKGLPWREDTATHCIYCGSASITKQAESRLAVVLTYPLWRCNDCAGVFELTRNDGRVGRVRGAGR